MISLPLKKQEAHEGLCSTGMVLLVIFKSEHVLCMGNKGKMNKQVLFSSIFNYYLSLVKIGEEIETLVCSQSCIIAILTISRAIIQSCMVGSDWFFKRTKLSSIFNYYLSLVKDLIRKRRLYCVHKL